MVKIKNMFVDFKRYMPLLYNLTARDLKVKYRRSVLGLLWSVLNPLLTMMVLTQVFRLLMRVEVPDYAVYFILGFAMYNFFSDATTASMGAMLGAAPLIKKVHIPKYIFPLEKCMFAAVNFLFSMIAVVIVMLMNPLLNGGRVIVPTWSMLLFFVPMVYCFFFSLGVGLILSACTVFFRDILHLYGVFLTMLNYLTPIIYPMSLLEGHKTILTIVKLNPLYYFVDYFRSVMLYGTVPGLKTNLICIALCVVALLLGLVMFKKTQDKFILHI